MLGDADGALLGQGVGVSGRQADGYRPALPLSHPFRSVAPTRSTGYSCTQADGLHPSWQYPHGTNSHDAQAPVGVPVGSRVGWAVGALLGALVVLGALLVLGDVPCGALLGQGVGVSGRQNGGKYP